MTNSESTGATITIGHPKLYSMKEILILNLLTPIPSLIIGGLFGLGIGSIVVYVICCVKSISLGSLHWYYPPNLPPNLLFLLISGLVALLMSFFLIQFMPFFVAGNWYIRTIVKRLNIADESYGDDDIFQISFDPRLYKGIRGALEDADDIGLLKLEQEQLLFKGDHVTLAIPYSAIESIQTRNIGWRSLWMGGKRLRITGKIQHYNSVEFLERTSCTLSKSKKIANRIHHRLNEYVRGA
jgi:hypothetical protein